jgi:hypothetical protein
VRLAAKQPDEGAPGWEGRADVRCMYFATVSWATSYPAGRVPLGCAGAPTWDSREPCAG